MIDEAWTHCLQNNPSVSSACHPQLGENGQFFSKTKSNFHFQYFPGQKKIHMLLTMKNYSPISTGLHRVINVEV